MELLEGTRRRKTMMAQGPLKVEGGGQWEAFDFDVQESTVWLRSRRSLTDRFYKIRSIFSWTSVFITAILTSLVAFSIDSILKLLEHLKWDQVMEPLTAPGMSAVKVVFAFIGFNALFVAIASALVCIFEPVAAGSGIPEIKCVLNGNRQGHALGFKTLVVKAIGVLFSVAGSLPVGKEGPMIHCGAIIGSGIGQGMSYSLNLRAKVNTQFRNDLDKRDQIAAGAAAGVAAAFGAPIGGVLFCLEEGASYFNQTLIWRTFFGTMLGALFLDVCLAQTSEGNIESGHLVIDKIYIVEFGYFGGLAQTKWVLAELPLVIILGIICGLLGALFNFLQKSLSQWRRRFVPAKKPIRRFFEAILVSILVSSCCVIIPALFPLDRVCTPIADASVPLGDGTVGLNPKLKNNTERFFCEEGEFNQAATLFFQLSEKAMLNLFHNGVKFDYLVLGTFAVVYYLLAIVTYGIAVPSGLFVPCLTIGAAFGRFYGQLLHDWFPFLRVTNIGFYALLGSGGMLGGVARLTISATVILLEATQNVSYTIPVMICSLVAKLVGDQFTHGLYDIHIFLKKVPLLEEHPPVHSEKLQVQDVLTHRLEKFNEIVQVGEVQDILLNSTHSSFPVTRNDDGLFSGLITRNRLVCLIVLKAWFKDRPSEICGREFDVRPGHSSNLLRQEDLDHFYPRYPNIKLIFISDEERECWLDLTPYMNPGAYTVAQTTPVSRCFRLFRGLGLRHVPVLDGDHRPVGVVTRKCLMEEVIDRAIWESEEKRKLRMGSLTRPDEDAAMALQDYLNGRPIRHTHAVPASSHFSENSANEARESVEERDVEIGMGETEKEGDEKEEEVASVDDESCPLE